MSKSHFAVSLTEDLFKFFFVVVKEEEKKRTGKNHDDSRFFSFLFRLYVCVRDTPQQICPAVSRMASDGAAHSVKTSVKKGAQSSVSIFSFKEKKKKK